MTRQEHHSKPPQPASWEERFDEEFKIKSFIAKEIAAAEKRGRDDVGEKIAEIVVQTDWANDSLRGVDKLSELARAAE